MGSSTRVVITEDHFDAYERKIHRGVLDEVHRAAEAVTGRAKQYIIEWDAIITGDLYRSIGPEFTNHGESAAVVATVPYASYVHDGTEHMHARPFLAQAIEDQAPETEARLNEVLDRWYE